MEILLTERDVSKRIIRSIQTLRNDRSKGQGIPYIKVGRLVRYRQSDVEKFIENERIETNPYRR